MPSATTFESRRIGAIALILIACVPMLACLWDSDTLRSESRGLPGAAEIITGWFDRYPPLYYEMRLKRVVAELEKAPMSLELYDDAGVACDRLGKHDDAIAWMARKADVLRSLDPNAATSREHQYRYLANLGTFHAHRWFARGRDSENLADLERARDLIKEAIELNPEAHFGRERYQLLAIEWAIDVAKETAEWAGAANIPTLFDRLRYEDGVEVTHLGVARRQLKEAGFGDAPQGLMGLIALGNAWESFDIFFALMLALADNGDASLAALARERCVELLDGGKQPLYLGSAVAANEVRAVVAESYLPVVDSEAERVRQYYHSARAAADARNRQREDFILLKLRQGEHPDTHEGFWAGYDDPRPPAPPNGVFGLGSTDLGNPAFWIVGFVLTLVVVYAAFRTIRHARASRREPAARPDTAI